MKEVSKIQMAIGENVAKIRERFLQVKETDITGCKRKTRKVLLICVLFFVFPWYDFFVTFVFMCLKQLYNFVANFQVTLFARHFKGRLGFNTTIYNENSLKQNIPFGHIQNTNNN